MNQMLGDMLLFPAQQLINSLLRSDPHIGKSLARFNGKVLGVNCLLPPLQMVIAFEPASVELIAGDGFAVGLSADATVKGNGIDLLSMLLQQQKRPGEMGIEVSGDAEFLLDLRHCLASLDIRWDDYLAPLFGDIITGQLVETSADIRQWSEQAQKNIQRSVQDYLHEEARLVTSRRQGDLFSRELARLKQAIDRTEARMQRIESQLTTKGTGI